MEIQALGHNAARHFEVLLIGITAAVSYITSHKIIYRRQVAVAGPVINRLIAGIGFRIAQAIAVNGAIASVAIFLAGYIWIRRPGNRGRTRAHLVVRMVEPEIVSEMVKNALPDEKHLVVLEHDYVLNAIAWLNRWFISIARSKFGNGLQVLNGINNVHVNGLIHIPVAGYHRVSNSFFPLIEGVVGNEYGTAVGKGYANGLEGGIEGVYHSRQHSWGCQVHRVSAVEHNMKYNREFSFQASVVIKGGNIQVLRKAERPTENKHKYYCIFQERGLYELKI